MKNKKWYVALIVGILLLASCGKADEAQQKDSLEATATTNTNPQKTTVPTLFIHGYSGGAGSFGGMLKRLEKGEVTKKEIVLTVTADGEVQATGHWTSEAANPSIQVLFKDNKSHEWNQAEWIKNCLVFMRDNYGVTEVNLVGHSMGGVSALRYLTTFGGDESLPEIQKFVAIAAPFNNFVEPGPGETIESVLTNGPEIQSERYVDYVNGSSNLPTAIKILVIAGDVEDGSVGDEAVAVTDALSVVSLLRLHGNDVQEKIFYGKKAQHSKLHENVAVDQLVADFLWK